MPDAERSGIGKFRDVKMSAYPAAFAFRTNTRQLDDTGMYEPRGPRMNFVKLTGATRRDI
jgi:hypothetical protein